MGKVFITDYIKNPNFEKKILGNLLTKVKEDASVLLVWHKIINSEYLDKFPKVKLLIRYGVGCDNIDFHEIKKRGIMLCNTPDYGVDEVSDTNLAMLMNITRKLAHYDAISKKISDGSWQENIFKDIRRNSEIAVGIIGAGRIGSLFALKAKSVGFKVSIYDPYDNRGNEKILNVSRYDNLDELLKKSDVVSTNCILTDETKGMVNKKFIKKMKKGSSLINTARGAIIDNLDDFIEPIKSNMISNISLDVLPDEPPKKSILVDEWRKNKEWTIGKVIINPHSGYYSVQSYTEMRESASKNALRFLHKLRPYNILVDNS
tara:strand:- start:3902 stop:4855 length:954 start_codon:yes stop_codon:yes gene_type:complete